MLLALDVGNTHIVLGLYEGDKLLFDFRIETSARRTTDEYHVLLKGLLEISGISPSEVHSTIMASVVPSVNETLSDAIDRAFGHELLVVGPGIKTGMPILYENPREVGADRIVNAVAAYEKVKQAVVVVDFGTATTFDCISKRGEYMGGAIAPGIAISADALFSHAAKLPKVEIVKPPHAIGRNTVQSVQAGLIYGYVALVDGLVRRLVGEIGDPCRVVATGGLAAHIQSESETIELVDENLTLEGLRILYARNT